MKLGLVGVLVFCITCLVVFSSQQAFAAVVAFEEGEYLINDRAQILIHDFDKNLNPGIPDIFSVLVTSDTKPDGLQVTFVETAKDSGFFRGGVEFTKQDNSLRKLQVNIGDKVYLQYGDVLETAKIIGEPIICAPHQLTLDDLNCISKTSVGFDPEVDLEIKTLKTKYNRGEPIRISGFALFDPDAEKHVTLKIINPKLQTVVEKEILSNQANKFKFDIDTNEELWDLEGEYTVVADYGKENATTTFDIIKFVLPQTIGKGNIFIMPGTNTPGCQILGNCYQPNPTEVGIGENVTWINADPLFKHFVVSGNPVNGPDGLYRSKALSPSGMFSYKFNQPGTYTFYDSNFPWMTGLIKVKEKHLLSDFTAPLILVPKNMTITADSKTGAFVNFTTKAIDDTAGVFETECTHEPGSFFPIGLTTVTCTAVDNQGNVAVRDFRIDVMSSEAIFPKWIKDLASMWCEDEIDESSFIEAIQYLINNEVIYVQASGSAEEKTQEIPAWVKENACWWSQGKTSDEDFAAALKFLISNGIIKV